MRVRDAPLVIEVDDLLEGREAAVVPVGRRSGNIAQGRGLEPADGAGMFPDTILPEVGAVGVPIDAKIMEFFVGKIESRVAARTPTLPLKECQASLGRFGHGVLLAAHVKPVSRAVTGQDRPLK